MSGVERSSVEVVIDANHEMYLHHGDSPGVNLVTKVLEGENYSHWSRSMIIALRAKNKLGFVNGSCVIPAEDSFLRVHWERCNSMVISWIIHAVTNEIAESIVYCSTAQDIWKELEQRFGKSNVAKVYQIQRDLCSVSQGNLSITSYFTKVK